MPTTLASERVRLVLDEDPLGVAALTHPVAGATVCAGGRQHFLMRLPNRPSDPVFLRTVSEVEATEDAVAFTVSDESDDYRARVTIQPTDEGLQFHLAASAPEPVWMVEWKLSGLELDEVIVPALGGQALGANMPPGTSLAFKYPFWWNAQFALAEISGGHGLWLRTTDVAPRFKLLRVHKPEEDEALFALGLGFEAGAPITAHTLEATWTLDGYSGGWQVPVTVHRRWLEETFGLVPYREHPHFPDWAEHIDFVLEIWGMRKDQGRPGHTFDDIIERIEAFADKHPPERTLLYLPGFAEGGIDDKIPDYEPGPMLGGRDGFRRLVDRAHALGYRVMIHTNVLGMTYSHPRFPEFERHQVVDPFGRPQGWGNDLDGDWLAEPYFAYINPGADAWGVLMEETLGGLIEDFGLDAVFLDQTLLAFNDSRGPNFVVGMRRHIERLQRAYPDVLFAGEGLNEQVLPALPLAQIHGLDSIAEVHGMEGEMPWRRVHPVSVALFGKYTKFVAHLLTKHPTSADFERQEAAYAELGVVPGLVLYRRSHSLDGPAVDAMLARADRLATTGPMFL